MDRRTFLTAILTLPWWGIGKNSAYAATSTPPRFFYEVFSFTCPYCYRLAQQLKTWKAEHPKVKAYPIHIISNGDDLKNAASFYAATLLGQGEAYREYLFDALFKKQKELNEKLLVSIAQAVGLEPLTFVQTMKGSDVAELLARSESITKTFQINATPTLIIDGVRVRLPDKEPLAILQEEFGGDFI